MPICLCLKSWISIKGIVVKGGYECEHGYGWGNTGHRRSSLGSMMLCGIGSDSDSDGDECSLTGELSIE
jgi:hypothetical protein